jgi:transposase-like protein
MTAIYKSNDLNEILDFLKKEKLINSEMKCSKCKCAMDWKKRLGGDKYSWRCPQCKTFKSIRTGSFFELNRLPFDKVLKAMFHFTSEIKIVQTAQLLDIARSTITSFYQRLRFFYNYFIFYLINCCNFLT